MRFVSSTLVAATLAVGTLADLHNVAVCITGRTLSNPGGTPFSPSMTYYEDYEVLVEATKCACEYYSNRNTGFKQWDRCPDCTFDPNDGYCHSEAWHIGGDEMEHYCVKYCGAQGAAAN
ncbi:hypothetical protein CKM354_000894700 [Cercospora kikuchii]|uniref:Uncharacterized protein n=1 Tax=Cercospora kikuchii TaxID=84275 RepID=A0A9P3FK16_9PEZI|nr:uncharacterized protein CKM354_000894700 [Cercospora kikuchii]GIZ45795.1 hypothetical protein CKM354_000894700 [Cercospora kikuchii]